MCTIHRQRQDTRRPPHHLLPQQRQSSGQSPRFAVPARRAPAAPADVGLDARSLAVHLLDVPPRPAAGVEDPAQALGQRRQPLHREARAHRTARAAAPTPVHCAAARKTSPPSKCAYSLMSSHHHPRVRSPPLPQQKLCPVSGNRQVDAPPSAARGADFQVNVRLPVPGFVFFPLPLCGRVHRQTAPRSSRRHAPRQRGGSLSVCIVGTLVYTQSRASIQTRLTSW